MQKDWAVGIQIVFFMVWLVELKRWFQPRLFSALYKVPYPLFSVTWKQVAWNIGVSSGGLEFAVFSNIQGSRLSL